MLGFRLHVDDRREIITMCEFIKYKCMLYNTSGIIL